MLAENVTITMMFLLILCIFQESKPKVLLAATSRPHSKTLGFLHELKRVIPNSAIKWRANAKIQSFAAAAHSKGYTDLVVVNEDNKIPSTCKA